MRDQRWLGTLVMVTCLSMGVPVLGASAGEAGEGETVGPSDEAREEPRTVVLPDMSIGVQTGFRFNISSEDIPQAIVGGMSGRAGVLLTEMTVPADSIRGPLVMRQLFWEARGSYFSFGAVCNILVDESLTEFDGYGELGGYLGLGTHDSSGTSVGVELVGLGRLSNVYQNGVKTVERSTLSQFVIGVGFVARINMLFRIALTCKIGAGNSEIPSNAAVATTIGIAL